MMKNAPPTTPSQALPGTEPTGGSASGQRALSHQQTPVDWTLLARGSRGGASGYFRPRQSLGRSGRLDRCSTAVALALLLVPGALAAEPRVPVARVNNEPVYADEVDRELRAALGEEVDLAQVRAAVRRRAAEQVVDRRLVLDYLVATKQGASAQDVDYALEQLKKELAAQNLTLEEYYERGGWTAADFRRHLAWTLSWQPYVATLTTDSNLQKYFDRHRSDFDGTKVRVAHLLLKVPAGDDAARAAALAQASKLREQIVGGQLSFSDAVRKFSQAPTAEDGGDLGFIARHEPMPEAFSEAAFQLKSQEVSQPVVTSFGVHLIQCLEIKPGQRTWRDAAGELRPAVALYLFRWIAEKERAKAKIEWLSPE